MMALTTTGRRSGQQRRVMLGYLDDGANVVALAMNGWAVGDPAWWLNLQAHPGATIDLVTGRRTVRARASEGDERMRLWARWRELDSQLDEYAARRPGATAIVVFEPIANGPHDREISVEHAAQTVRDEDDLAPAPQSSTRAILPTSPEPSGDRRQGL